MGAHAITSKQLARLTKQGTEAYAAGTAAVYATYLGFAEVFLYSLPILTYGDRDAPKIGKFSLYRFGIF